MADRPARCRARTGRHSTRASDRAPAHSAHRSPAVPCWRRKTSRRPTAASLPARSGQRARRSRTWRNRETPPARRNDRQRWRGMPSRGRRDRGSEEPSATYRGNTTARARAWRPPLAKPSARGPLRGAAAAEHRNSPRLRQPLLDELDAFADKLDGEIAHAGEIAAGPGPALHELDVERIAAEAEHDGLCDLERAQAQDRELLRHDHFGIGCEELAPHSFHIVQSRRPEAANGQIAAFAPTQLAQARAQRLQIG